MSTPPSDADHDPPGSGFEVPPGFGADRSPLVETPADDPLVPPAGSGFGEWWERVSATLGASGGKVMLIFLLTLALPQLVASVLIDQLAGGFVSGGMVIIPLDGEVETASGGLIALSVVLGLGTILVSALGWGAAIFVVTQVASGRQMSLAVAFAAAARRLAPMFGWYLLYSVMVAAGLLLLVLPGIYLGAAGALFSFVVMYERGRNAMAHSFRLAHWHFPAVAGRFVLVLGFMAAGLLLVGCCVGFLVGDDSPAGGVGLFAITVSSLADVPIYAVALVALLITYTQVRGRQEPLSTEQLRQEINQRPAAGPPGY